MSNRPRKRPSGAAARVGGAALAAGALLLASCAHMEAPPGGPVDTKRPYVIGVFPAPDTVNVSRDLKAQVAFSEWVAPDAERGKAYLVPPLARKIRTRLSGNLLEVTSAGRLDTNTTYVLGLLPTVKDLNGQSLEAPLQLVFSTGPALDTGRLEGRLGVFLGKPAAGGFAALYPRGAELRARFQHLTRRNDSAVVPSTQPDPAKERPAYIAPADSLGRFGFKGLRPGRYGLLGFQDINGDLVPGIGPEPQAIGPSVDVGLAGSPGEAQTLTLAPYDSMPVRLVEARWVGESIQGKRASGTVRLKFNRPPHPIQALSREAYSLRRAGPGNAPPSGAPVPVQDVCLNPVTGEIELYAGPLDLDSQYVAGCAGLRDLYSNPVDTARSRAAFGVGRAPDTAKPDMIFLAPRRVSGEMPRLPPDQFLPSRGLNVYYPRLITDSALGWLGANLVLKADTASVAGWSLARLSHHEFSLRFPPGIPLKGQRLSLGWKPADTAKAPIRPAPQGPAARPPAPAKDSLGRSPSASPAPATPQPVPIAAFTLADASKLGSLKFPLDRSAQGSRLVLRSLASAWEYVRTVPAAEEMVVDSLPEGRYAVDYFRDTNGDGIWHPGSLSPWAVQEPYAHWADSVEVKAGGVGPGGQAPNSRIGQDAGNGAPAEPAMPAPRKLSWPPAP